MPPIGNAGVSEISVGAPRSGACTSIPSGRRSSTTLCRCAFASALRSPSCSCRWRRTIPICASSSPSIGASEILCCAANSGWHSTPVKRSSGHRMGRSPDPRDPAGGAEGEVPAQRFAAITDAEGDGFALFVPEVYGWSVRGLRAGGVDVGISLLRGRHRSDPAADLGEARFTFALAPLRRAPVSAIERAWRLFVQDERVALFSPVDESVIVVATKPADDGDGVVVRVRECDGESRRARLYCAGRAREAIADDALERQVADDVRLEDGHLVFTIGPYALRAFRVRF